MRDPDKAKRVVEVDRALLTTDVDAAIARDDVDIVCELIGGTTEAQARGARRDRGGQARRHREQGAARRARRRDLRARPSAPGVDVYYEAAVCGGVPIIRVLREGLASRSRRGAVRHRQRHVELHPVDDDRDAPRRSPTSCATRRRSATPRPIRRSTSAAATPRTSSRSSSACASAPRSTSRAIPTDGIDVVEPIDLDYAEQVRLRDQAARDRARSRRARSRRASIPRWCRRTGCSPTSRGAKNAVYVQSYALGPSMYYGAGAGMLPTAMAVVSDMIEIGRNIFARAAGATRPAARPLDARAAGAARRHPLALLPAVRRRRPARRARPADDDPRRAPRLDRAGRPGRGRRRRSRSSSSPTRRARATCAPRSPRSTRSRSCASPARVIRIAGDDARDPRHLRRHRPDGRRLLRELPALLRERARRRTGARSAGATRTSRRGASRCR